MSYEDIFTRYSSPSGSYVIRRPLPRVGENLIDGGWHDKDFIINNNRPAFDAADFVRVGKSTIVGQLSNVTNMSGVRHLECLLQGTGIEVYLLESTDSHTMHIDTTFLPLREGFAIYHPDRVSIESLNKIPALSGWTFVVRPTPPVRDHGPPMFMSS